MFTNTRKILKKSMICLPKRKNELFIHSVDSRHVEAAILMTYCGLRTALEQKRSEKTPFFDPYFWGDL